MALNLKDDLIAYNDNILVDFLDRDDVMVYWDNVAVAIEDIKMESLFIFTGNDQVARLKVGLEDNFLIKGYCLALMFARNWGFRSNIDLHLFENVWNNWSASANPKRDVAIFGTEVAVTEDIDKTDTSIYEEIYIVGNRKYTMYASVDWKAVLAQMSIFDDGDKDLNVDILLALGLSEARQQGLKEGGPL